MKLSEWRKINNHTQAWLGEMIGVDQGYVSRIERAVESQMPSREILKNIYVVTRGEVQPNDFYDLPLWEATLIRAAGDAELARKAA